MLTYYFQSRDASSSRPPAALVFTDSDLNLIDLSPLLSKPFHVARSGDPDISDEGGRVLSVSAPDLARGHSTVTIGLDFGSSITSVAFDPETADLLGHALIAVAAHVRDAHTG